MRSIEKILRSSLIATCSFPMFMDETSSCQPHFLTCIGLSLQRGSCEEFSGTLVPELACAPRDVAGSHCPQIC